MGTSDGSVGSVTNLTHNGSLAWSIVVMGDGYRSSEMDKYHADVKSFVARLLTVKPFNGLRKAIEVYRVDVTSTDSGTDDEGGGTKKVRTYFDTSFGFDGVPRLLSGNVATAVSVAQKKVGSSYGSVVVLVNSSGFGGSADIGNKVAFCTLTSAMTAVHELGHSGFGLADEYPYYVGCGQESDRDVHPGDEPSNINVTTIKKPLKWQYFVTDSPALEMVNKPPSNCLDKPNPFNTETVGLFEGADSYHCGVYRPQHTCLMRDFKDDFCVVCQQRIIQTLAGRVPYQSVVSVHTGWVFDAAAATHAMVQQFPPHGGPNQHFRFEPVARNGTDTVYRIRPLGDYSLAVDVAGASKAPGASLQLFPWHRGENQMFEIIPDGNHFRLRNLNSKLYVQVDAGPPAGGVPLSQGTLLPASDPNVNRQRWLPMLEEQSGWHWCHLCQGLFFGPNVADSTCPAGGRHAMTQFDYSVSDSNPPVANWQDGWRWCRKCQAMFFAGHTTLGVCPDGGGPHDHTGSGAYAIQHGMPPSGAEHGWRWCRLCEVLFWDGAKSICPANFSGHDATQSGPYSLSFF